MTHVIGRQVNSLFQEVSHQLTRQLTCPNEESLFIVELTKGCTLAEALGVFGLCCMAFPQLSPTFHQETHTAGTPHYEVGFHLRVS